MKIYISTCETKSFTQTALNLSLPKASITAAIQQIEKTIGVQLLQRTTRSVTITADGEQFYERCKSLLADLADLENMFDENNAKLSGCIRADMPVSIAKNVIIPKLPFFLNSHPNIKLELSSTDRRVNLISEGFDFIVRVGTMKDSELICKKIGEYSMVNCASPAYLKQYGTPKKISDLSSHYQVHYSQNLGSQSDGFEHLVGKKYSLIKTKSMISVNSTEAYTAACLAGLGIIQVPRPGIEYQLRTGELKQIMKEYTAEPMGVYLIYTNKGLISRRVRVLMEWTEKQIKAYLSTNSKYGT